MAESWMTSWFWRWRGLAATPPGEPQAIPEHRARQVARLLDVALSPATDVGGPLFLALSHERLLAANESETGVRIDYRVAARVRFPDGEGARGAAQRASAHILRLETSGRLLTTRGPFHLSEVLAQGGVALLTVRADLLSGGGHPRLATYAALAITRGGGPLEPMHIVLLDLAANALIWTSDDVLSRAWHAPLAGGEILALIPSAARPVSERSAARIASRERQTNAPTLPAIEAVEPAKSGPEIAATADRRVAR